MKKGSRGELIVRQHDKTQPFELPPSFRSKLSLSKRFCSNSGRFLAGVSGLNPLEPKSVDQRRHGKC